MLGKPLLFFSSYAPLFGLLAIRFQQPYLWASCLGLAVVGVTSLLLLLHLDAHTSRGAYTLLTTRDAGPEAASYLASYLLPFLTVATPSIRDIAAYIGFLIVAASIYLRSAVVQVNPLLFLLGYRILAITDDNGLRGYMITRRSISTGSEVIATRWRDEVLVDRP